MDPPQEAASSSANPTPDQIAEWERHDEEERKKKDHYERQQRWHNFEDMVHLRGLRYKECKLSNFEATTDEQKAVLKTVCDFARNVRPLIDGGTNLILYGPRGTGKDHLLAALMWGLILNHGAQKHSEWSHRDLTLNWGDGLTIFSRMRDSFDDRRTSEREIIAEYASPTVLALSDPLPPLGVLTDFQQSALFRILDRRYNRRMPTWVTINVSGRDEMDERLGPQNADRLRDNALAIHCNWESYRKALP